jgi:hypothetical protein
VATGRARMKSQASWAGSDVGAMASNLSEARLGHTRRVAAVVF